MAILVKNQTVTELLDFLLALSTNRNIRVHSSEFEKTALELREALLSDLTESEITDLKKDGEYPKPTKGGAWIV